MSDYASAKARADALWEASSSASKALNDFLATHPKAAFGLTPDNVKAMPEYKQLSSAYNVAASKLRAFNGKFVKEFRHEIRAERSARLQRKSAYQPAV